MPPMETTYQKLYFPLNVYAVLMHSLVGKVPFLSYGCLADQAAQQSPSATLLAGQFAAAERLAGALALPPPARVLDVGCGSGTFAGRLAKAGYQVTALDNNAAAVQLARENLADLPDGTVRFVQQSFELFWRQAPAASYDVIVLQNSARYFLPLVMFAAARHLLAPGGQLLLLDEFVTNTHSGSAPQSLPVMEHVLALAGRTGFSLVEDEDLSADTGRFMRVFLTQFESGIDRLPALSGETEQVINALHAGLRRDTDGCLDGTCCHHLLSWRLTVHDGQNDVVELLPATCVPVDNYRPIFELSFKTDFDADLWHWKYATGRGASVVAVREQSVVAHYGGVARDIRYFGRACSAVQICDVMVLPGQRGFFSRSGLFFKTAASMLEQYAGYGAPYLLGFGFPNLKAMHVAERLGLYEKSDELLAISNPVAEAVTGWQVSEFSAAEGIAAYADSLWQQMEVDFSDAIIGLRDAAYLNYRFVQRPGLDYRCVVVHHHGNAVALGVLREHGEQYLLMDIVGAAEVLSAAFSQICVFGRSVGRPVVMWVTGGQAHRLQSPDLLTESTGIQIPCNRWSRGPETALLQGAWWLTAGDMDFM